MNITEFAALKVGDQIESRVVGVSRGEVIELKNNGVMIAWEGNTKMPFHFSVNSTAWFHWSKVE